MLAGGRATRLGGGDKPLRPLGGRPMLSRILERLGPQVGPVAISANGDPARFAEYGLPVLADDGRAGRAARRHSCREWPGRKSEGSDNVLTVAGDTPFFPADLAAKAWRRPSPARPDHIAVAASGGRRHPVFALWPVIARGRPQRFPGREHDIQRLGLPGAARHGQRRLPDGRASKGKTVDPFFNVNTPDDLAQAEAIAARRKAMTQRVFGITGWKNSGKTDADREAGRRELTRRGWKVSTVKHAHHDFDIDKEGTDSFRHRQAGASEVAIVSGRRWALMHELRGEDEPTLDEVLARLAPCDLVLVEGYKRESHKKIETRRPDAKDTAPLSAADPTSSRSPPDHRGGGRGAARLRSRRRRRHRRFHRSRDRSVTEVAAC